MNKLLVASLPYFQIFATVFTAVILTFMPSLLTYKQFVVGISILSAIILFCDKKSKTLKSFGHVYGALFIMIFVLSLYTLTSSLYISSSNAYKSFYMVLLGQTIPSVLFAAYVSYDKEVILKIKQLLPFWGSMFSFVVAFTVFFPTSLTSAGYIDSENGLNYQSTSYAAAYASGFLFYYYIFRNDIDWVKPFDKPILKKTSLFLILLNFVGILLAGGRGGFVLFVIISLYAVHLLKRKQTSVKIGNYIIFSVVVIASIYMCISFVMESSFEVSGFHRIVDTMESGTDVGRSAIRSRAIESFMNSPIIGHGIGSIFYEIGEYSHNCFTDILVEAGFIGFLFFVYFIFKFYKKLKSMIKKDITECCWIFIFLDGFILSLFSGYYIGIIPMWWPMTYVFCSIQHENSISYEN